MSVYNRVYRDSSSTRVVLAVLQAICLPTNTRSLIGSAMAWPNTYTRVTQVTLDRLVCLTLAWYASPTRRVSAYVVGLWYADYISIGKE